MAGCGSSHTRVYDTHVTGDTAQVGVALVHSYGGPAVSVQQGAVERQAGGWVCVVLQLLRFLHTALMGDWISG